MNFFGHAAVASTFELDPAFVLGSMLPDFCTMLATRTPHVPDPALARGVRFHHVTDGAFHESEEFQRLNRRACKELAARGLARGSARAVAHIGVELLIDGVLARSEPSRRAYLSALEISRDLDPEHAIGFPRGDGARFAELVLRLLDRGVVADPQASSLAERLRRTLAYRPRLAFPAESVWIVEEWIVQARPDVVASVPALTDALLAKLRRTMAEPPASSV